MSTVMATEEERSDPHLVSFPRPDDSKVRPLRRAPVKYRPLLAGIGARGVVEQAAAWQLAGYAGTVDRWRDWVAMLGLDGDVWPERGTR